jgi:hypothetical protein
MNASPIIAIAIAILPASTASAQGSIEFRTFVLADAIRAKVYNCETGNPGGQCLPPRWEGCMLGA